MTVIEQILLHLRERQPELRFISDDKTIEARPDNEDGFPVYIMALSDEYTGDDCDLTVGVCGTPGLHLHEYSMESATDLFLQMLSKKCRLRYEYHGDTPTKISLELKEQSVWATCETLYNMSYFFRLILGKERIVCSMRAMRRELPTWSNFSSIHTSSN